MSGTCTHAKLGEALALVAIGFLLGACAMAGARLSMRADSIRAVAAAQSSRPPFAASVSVSADAARDDDDPLTRLIGERVLTPIADGRPVAWLEVLSDAWDARARPGASAHFASR